MNNNNAKNNHNIDFSDLSYSDFAQMANNDNLSRHEKVGFPDTYRKGKEKKIVQEIIKKFKLIQLKRNSIVLDIGPGCSKIPRLIAKYCQKNQYKLLLADSEQVLKTLPDIHGTIEKYPGFYPDITSLTDRYLHQINFILCYSVFQYIYKESNMWLFLDTSLALLADGGALFIGDIPNISSRKRFFSSNTGMKFHQNFMHTSSKPKIKFNQLESSQIDDAIVMAILQRARLQGFHAYVLPQQPDLPMANRREDILIIKP